jgi:3-oxoacyl-[acyl-carrier protein] reductase
MPNGGKAEMNDSMRSITSMDHASLKERVVIVTGAGSGIGKASALTLATHGARVAVAEIVPEAARQTVRAIEAAGGESLAVEVDVSSEDGTARMAEAVSKRFGRIDGLVNNAGVWGDLRRKPFHDISVQEWDTVMAINLRGVFLCSKAVCPYMREKGYGKIINITSTTAFFGSPFLLQYVTSKAGIIGLTRSLARELGKDGVRVNAIAPGLTETEASLRNTGRDRFSELAGQTALNRVAQPNDIAKAIMFFVSGESDFITGQTLVVDGGMVFH